MDLIAKLQEDMKAAMKSGAKDRLGIVRMLLSEAKNADLQSPKKTPEQMIEAFTKKLKNSATEMEKYNKPDEVAKLKAEIAIAEEYLPKKLGEAETETFTEKQAGQAMGAFLKANPNCDGGIVNKLIRAKLAGK
jgi:uncharacterized protein